MTAPRGPVRQRSGTVLQSGTPKRAPTVDPLDARGLLVRGVVTATYVSDSPARPLEGATLFRPVSVYCDVLTYSTLPRARWSFLPQVPVSQHTGRMHDGEVWKPRATTMDITGATLDVQKASNPANFDGDHVLIGFLENNLNQPIILRGIAHPAVDTGGDAQEKGHRLRLKLADGDPHYWRHHGSFYGVDENGDHVIDTTWARDGELASDGTEAQPPTDGKGSHRRRMPADAEDLLELRDMTDPSSPVPVVTHSQTKDQRELLMETAGGDPLVSEITNVDQHERTLGDGVVVTRENANQIYREIVDKLVVVMTDSLIQWQCGGGDTFKVEGNAALAVATVGDGADAPVMATPWSAFWDAFANTIFNAHVHPDAMGVTGPPVPPALPYASSAATSTKLKAPLG